MIEGKWLQTIWLHLLYSGAFRPPLSQEDLAQEQRFASLQYGMPRVVNNGWLYDYGM